MALSFHFILSQIYNWEFQKLDDVKHKRQLANAAARMYLSSLQTVMIYKNAQTVSTK